MGEARRRRWRWPLSVPPSCTRRRGALCACAREPPPAAHFRVRLWGGQPSARPRPQREGPLCRLMIGCAELRLPFLARWQRGRRQDGESWALVGGNPPCVAAILPPWGSRVACSSWADLPLAGCGAMVESEGDIVLPLRAGALAAWPRRVGAGW